MRNAYLKKYEMTRDLIDTLEVEELNGLTIGDMYLRDEDEADFAVVTGWGAFYYAIFPLLEKRYLNSDIDVYFDGHKANVTVEDLDYPLSFKERVEEEGVCLITVIGKGTVTEFML